MSDLESNDPTDQPAGGTERITLDDYRRRAALGEFSASNAVELLEGVIVPKSRQSLRHEAALEKIQDVLGKLVPNGWHLRVQKPLATFDSQPEPDIAVVRNVLEDFMDQSLKIEDVALVIEAADASLLRDRRLKGRVYARANVQCYWVLNLLDSQLEVFTKPSGMVPLPGYHEERTYRLDDKVDLIVLEDVGMIRVGDIIP